VNGGPTERLEERVLILAPVGKDATLIEEMLAPAIACARCRDLEQMAAELERGAAALLLTEEALASGATRLSDLIASQPPWSDLPVLLLTGQGADSAVTGRALDTLGNVTLLERPVRVAALASAVRSALRARERQYRMRAHLEDRERADRNKDEFMAALAHELRNPLAPIRNSVHLLSLSGAAPEVVEIMERQVSHLVRLVDDLMEASRMTRGKIRLHKEVVDLATIMAAAVEMSHPLIEAAGHRLTVDVPASPIAVEADRTRLTQVFSNLLNNAANYTDPGGSISVAVRRDGDAVAVTVSDTGVGIPAEALTRVFDMFAQVPVRDGTSQSGLGIGLTLARSLVELHGGTLTAASEGLGKGSRFTVRLPMSAREPATASPRYAATPCVDKSQRILVVDDNQDAATSLGELLRMLGAEVQVVHDGESALEAFDTFRPRVTLLDLGMPGMDGYEVARRIRARSGSERTALIALTGWGQERDRLRTAEAGFDCHLTKPVDINTVTAALASVDAGSEAKPVRAGTASR
jgi:signal transduction histidine kinase/ActR/RegA family two-component response regulator